MSSISIRKLTCVNNFMRMLSSSTGLSPGGYIHYRMRVNGKSIDQ
jgi:hypothetical protein